MKYTNIHLICNNHSLPDIICIYTVITCNNNTGTRYIFPFFPNLQISPGFQQIHLLVLQVVAKAFVGQRLDQESPRSPGGVASSHTTRLTDIHW